MGTYVCTQANKLSVWLEIAWLELRNMCWRQRLAISDWWQLRDRPSLSPARPSVWPWSWHLE